MTDVRREEKNKTMGEEHSKITCYHTKMRTNGIRRDITHYHSSWWWIDGLRCYYPNHMLEGTISLMLAAGVQYIGIRLAMAIMMSRV